jgi:hypothetical protein
MSADDENEKLLQEVLDRIIQRNMQIRPGTPMAELKNAIESAISSLPPLEYQEFKSALDDKDAANKLVDRAPEMIGWNADKMVELIEELAKKLSS